MKDFINIGPTPPAEDCAQVCSENYPQKARAECRRYIKVIREKLGEEPEGARLAIKSFPHEFNTYYEVVCYYESENIKARDYAFGIEDNGPLTWDEAEEQ